MNRTCDCCLRPVDRMWVYRHRAFCCVPLKNRQEYRAGWWAFCVYCHPLFVAHDYYALAARVCSLLNLSAAAAHKAFEDLYRIVGDAAYGEVLLWHEGEDLSERRFPCPPPDETA